MLQQLWDMVMSVFGSLGQDGLIAMGAIVVIAGLMLRGFGSLVRFTLGALVLFAVVMMGRQVLDGSEPVGLVQARSQEFLQLPMGTFLVYFVSFLVVIGAIYFIKSRLRSH